MIELARQQAYQDFTIDGDNLLMIASGICDMQDTDEPSVDNAQVFFRTILSRLKMSGLKDMMMGAIDCLMAQLTLDEALPVIVQKGLQSMMLEDLGRLIDSLPDQDIIDCRNRVKIALQNRPTRPYGANIAKYLEESTDKSPSTNLRPWMDPDIIRAAKARFYENTGGGRAGQASAAIQSRIARKSGSQTRTLAQRFDRPKMDKLAEAGVIMQHWIEAIIEKYRLQGQLLDVIELLNHFPGSALLSKALLLLDCPPAQLVEGLNLDFMNDVELPLFQGIDDITMPAMRNPLEWLPEWKDITAVIPVMLKTALQKLIMSVMSRLIVKISNVVSSRSCLMQAMGGTENIDIGAYNNQDEFFNMVRDGIAGPQASFQEIAATTKDMFSKLGFGNSPFENPEGFMDFIYDMSSNLTRREMMEMFLGRPGPEALDVIDQLIEYDYPEYREAMPNADSIQQLTANVGNLFPAEFKEAMNDFANNLPASDRLPANPSLCASDEDIERFCENRQRLLSSRASTAQIEQMCESARVDQIQTLGDLIEADPGKIFADSLPPIQSDPGCDNGIIPFEPESVTSAVNKSLDLLLQQIQIDFTTDMMGNGPGEANWGLMNMILSDTMGNPLSAHYRKSSFNDDYVDFVRVGYGSYQKGQFPYKIAEWLQYSVGQLSGSINYNNTYSTEEVKSKSIFELGVKLQYKAADSINQIKVPVLGYDTEPIIDIENKNINFVKKARKSDPDIVLPFRDNNGGRDGTAYLNAGAGSDTYTYGFDIGLYFSDVIQSTSGEITNRPTDNVRVKVTDLMNFNADFTRAEFKSMTAAEKLEYIAAKARLTASIQADTIFEFLCYDDTFDLSSLSRFPVFQTSFVGEPSSHAPQTVLFKEIIDQNNTRVREFDSAITNITLDQVSDIQKTVSEIVLASVTTAISGNEAPFLYGAQYDPLTRDDTAYVVKTGQTDFPGGSLYSDATINGYPITPDDAVFGTSYDQYINEQQGTPENTRVFYLDPVQYGGSYVRPPIFIKPMKNDGWLGMIEAIFPENGSESEVDIINFPEIARNVSRTQNKIPLDERLRKPTGELEEYPYNRVLERSSISGIQGIISAACRIYGTIHYLKTLGTFMTFEPDFENTYSPIYAHYIVESMEESFKNTTGALWDMVSPFSDEEFWYMFLEQGVQTYGRLVDENIIANPPKSVLNSLFKINDMQDRFGFYTREEFMSTMAGRSGAQKYEDYIMEEKIKAIKGTETHAKNIMKEMVILELKKVNENMMKNLAAVGISPVHNDMNYYFLKNFVHGTDSLNSIVDSTEQEAESEIGVPLHGQTSLMAEHIHEYEIDAEGNGWAYTAYHPTQPKIFHKHQIINYQIQEAQSDCYPNCKNEYGVDGVGPHIHYINDTTTTIGDVQEWDKAARNPEDIAGYVPPDTTQKPFTLEKYVKINNVIYSVTDAKVEFSSASTTNDLNVSDVYPGTMKEVLDVEGKVVGITGELGIRFGLQFSIYIEGEYIKLASVEMDSLDVKISDMQWLEADTKELECLVKMLIKDENYRLVTKYIIPTNKMLSALAVYNDRAFMPSIGEVTVDTGAYAGAEVSEEGKPGVIVSFDEDYKPVYTYREGWASVDDRNPGLLSGLLIREWDSWDQELLRNTKSRIKSLFKSYYFSRDFEDKVERMLKTNPAPSNTRGLKLNLRPSTSRNLLPRWQRKLTRFNVPVDNLGNILDKLPGE